MKTGVSGSLPFRIPSVRTPYGMKILSLGKSMDKEGEDLRFDNVRLSICKSCEHYKKNISVCSKCGCIMPLKVRFINFKCPVGKW